MSVFEIIYLVSLVICLLGFLISGMPDIPDMPLYGINCIFPVIPIINTLYAILYILLFIGICFEVLYRKIYFIKTYRK